MLTLYKEDVTQARRLLLDCLPLRAPSWKLDIWRVIRLHVEACLPETALSVLTMPVSLHYSLVNDSGRHFLGREAGGFLITSSIVTLMRF